QNFQYLTHRHPWIHFSCRLHRLRACARHLGFSGCPRVDQRLEPLLAISWDASQRPTPRFAGNTFAIAAFNDIPFATVSRIAFINTSSRCACSTLCCHESAEMRDLTRTSSAATGSYI